MLVKPLKIGACLSVFVLAAVGVFHLERPLLLLLLAAVLRVEVGASIILSDVCGIHENALKHPHLRVSCSLVWVVYHHLLLLLELFFCLAFAAMSFRPFWFGLRRSSHDQSSH